LLFKREFLRNFLFCYFFRTFSNFERKKDTLQSIKNTEAVTHERNSNNESTDESEYEQQDAIKVPQKKNNNTCQDASQNIQNLEQDRNKHNKEINASRFKRRKIDESKSIDDTFTNISNAIINFIESTKENTTSIIC